jgi:two-component system chemotaxis response regulator CheB
VKQAGLHKGDSRKVFSLGASQAFLSAWKQGSCGETRIFIVADADEDALARWIKAVERKLGPRGELEFKFVGSEKAAKSFASMLSKLGVFLKGSWGRPFQALEIHYHPDTNRLQVAEQAAAAESPRASAPARESAPKKVKVLIVDDSASIRKILATLFSTDPNIEVVGVAERPSQVEELITKVKPDVITLDIHMPEMTGVELLKRYLPRHSIPTVMISSISMEESPMVLEALENGAVDYIQKPAFQNLAAQSPFILEKVKAAAGARVKAATRQVSQAFREQKLRQDLILAIGSSTGGTEALREVLTQLPASIPPTLIVQHIPPVFSLAFANRMNELCPFEVKEAADGDEVRPGRVLIAPGGLQMRLVREGSGLKVRVEDTAPVNRHKPSVDVLFDSVAAEIGKKALGVILTGMGADGANGLLKMRQAGARTVAQDEESCVVFGMPREAIARGAAEEIKSLRDIPQLLVRWLQPKT